MNAQDPEAQFRKMVDEVTAELATRAIKHFNRNYLPVPKGEVPTWTIESQGNVISILRNKPPEEYILRKRKERYLRRAQLSEQRFRRRARRLRRRERERLAAVRAQRKLRRAFLTPARKARFKRRVRRRGG